MDVESKRKCRACQEEKTILSFYKHKRSKNGFREICKKCHQKETRKYDTPEKKSKRYKRWAANNKDKRQSMNRKFQMKNVGVVNDRAAKHNLRYYGLVAKDLNKYPQIIELQKSKMNLERLIKQKTNGKHKSTSRTT